MHILRLCIHALDHISSLFAKKTIFTMCPRWCKCLKIQGGLNGILECQLCPQSWFIILLKCLHLGVL